MRNRNWSSVKVVRMKWLCMIRAKSRAARSTAVEETSSAG